MPAVTADFLRTYLFSSSSSTSSSLNSNITNLYSDGDHECQTPEVVEEEPNRNRGEETEDQVSLFKVLLTAFRKVLTVVCTTEGAVASTEDEEGEDRELMDIGFPTQVRHVAHVTFDRFHGFLGLPTELEPEVPIRAPSASATVFGVSTESMQCSFDSRGNSIPTILLMLQKRLYAQGGLQVEGIFRITAENSEAEHVREQLNSGIVPDDIDVHCLAGLIKAWFRELPDGVLDCLTPEEVLECKTEEDHIQLVSLLPPAESALLDWAVNLMADVVQQEHHNKMNEHNVATVFAPNMTQMADPLTALMHAVQVMNLLRTLIQRVIRERDDEASDSCSGSSSSSDNDHDENNDQDIDTTPLPLMKDIKASDHNCSRPPITHRKTSSEGPPGCSTGDDHRFFKVPYHRHSNSSSNGLPEIAPVLIKPRILSDLGRKKSTVQTQKTLTLNLTEQPKKVIGNSSSDKAEDVSRLGCVNNSGTDRDSSR